ncbi:Protein-lysine N-methyltransferase efm6 [Thecaphora frezii]
MTTYRNSLEEAEALDALDPLRHLLAASDDAADSSSSTSSPFVPAQRESIIDQRVTIRYYRDSTVAPVTFEPDSPPAAGGSGEKRGWYDITLKLNMTEGCGGKIWPAAEVLGAYIVGKGEERWKGKTVVELGSGTGLVGFLVAKMQSECRVWVTDQRPMLTLMQENLALNVSDMPGQCFVDELDWGLPIRDTIPSHPDVLLLADCVYRETAFQPLVDALLMLSTKQTEILFCYQKRRKADKRFFGLLKRHFTFDDIDDDDPKRTEIYRREGTHLYRVCRKAA